MHEATIKQEQSSPFTRKCSARMVQEHRADYRTLRTGSESTAPEFAANSNPSNDLAKHAEA